MPDFIDGKVLVKEIQLRVNTRMRRNVTRTFSSRNFVLEIIFKPTNLFLDEKVLVNFQYLTNLDEKVLGKEKKPVRDLFRQDFSYFSFDEKVLGKENVLPRTFSSMNHPDKPNVNPLFRVEDFLVKNLIVPS